jgi:hypothetical protein
MATARVAHALPPHQLAGPAERPGLVGDGHAQDRSGEYRPGDFIRFSQTVYQEAWAHKVRARWTAAHETGHFFLHTRKPMARVSSEAVVKPFECPERQAHQFAAELLMPRRFIDPSTSIEEIMRDFGVSEEAATKRHTFIVAIHRNG